MRIVSLRFAIFAALFVAVAVGVDRRSRKTNNESPIKTKRNHNKCNPKLQKCPEPPIPAFKNSNNVNRKKAPKSLLKNTKSNAETRRNRMAVPNRDEIELEVMQNQVHPVNPEEDEEDQEEFVPFQEVFGSSTSVSRRSNNTKAKTKILQGSAAALLATAFVVSSTRPVIDSGTRTWNLRPNTAVAKGNVSVVKVENPVESPVPDAVNIAKEENDVISQNVTDTSAEPESQTNVTEGSETVETTTENESADKTIDELLPTS